MNHVQTAHTYTEGRRRTSVTLDFEPARFGCARPLSMAEAAALNAAAADAINLPANSYAALVAAQQYLATHGAAIDSRVLALLLALVIERFGESRELRTGAHELSPALLAMPRKAKP